MSVRQGWPDELVDQWATSVWTPRTPKQVRPRMITVQSDHGQNCESLCPKCKKRFWKAVPKFRKMMEATTSARSPLAYYLDFIYMMRLSPYKESIEGSQLSRIVHKIIHGAFSTLSLVYAVRTSKTWILIFLAYEGHLGRLVSSAYFTIHGLAITYFTYFMIFKSESLDDILEAVSITEKKRAVREEKIKVTKRNTATLRAILLMPSFEHKIIGRGMGIMAILLVLIRLFFGFFAFDNSWSMTDFIEHYSYIAQSTVLLWNPGTFHNQTEGLRHEYSSGMSLSSIALGIPAAAMTFCGWLQETMLHNFLLLTTLSMFKNVSKFVDHLNDNQIEPDTKWELYREAKSRTKNINKPISLLLPLVHVYFSLLVAYFLLDGLEQRKYVGFVLFGFKVANVLYMYYKASQISDLNSAVREWIKKYGKENGPGSATDRNVATILLLDDADSQPIGLGTGELFLDQAFLKQFLGTVFTVFIILAESGKM